jgi:GT2 family glycosyltransferase
VELVFVDDASSDETAEWMDELPKPFVSVVTHTSNQGFASAMNSGVEAASGRFVVLLNNDLVFTRGWFDPFGELSRNWKPEIGLVGNVQFRLETGELDHAGIALNKEGRFEHVRTKPEHGQPLTCTFMTGACLMLERSDYLKLGGFDTGYVNGVEDLEMCLQLHASGKTNLLLPNSMIGHHVSASRRNADQEIRDARNLLRLYTRWADSLADLHQVSFPETNSRQVIAREAQRLRTILEHKAGLA